MQFWYLFRLFTQLTSTGFLQKQYEVQPPEMTMLIFNFFVSNIRPGVFIFKLGRNVDHCGDYAEIRALFTRHIAVECIAIGQKDEHRCLLLKFHFWETCSQSYAGIYPHVYEFRFFTHPVPTNRFSPSVQFFR